MKWVFSGYSESSSKIKKKIEKEGIIKNNIRATDFLSPKKNLKKNYYG